MKNPLTSPGCTVAPLCGGPRARTRAPAQKIFSRTGTAVHNCHDRALTALLVLLSLASCTPTESFYYRNSSKDLRTIGRVAIVELDNDSSYPQISADITEALFLALQKRQVFGLTTVRRDDPAWRSLRLDLDADSPADNSAFGVPSTFTLEQLSAARSTLKCDALLVGTVTEYRPYPRTAIGVRMKILDLKDGQLLWALEQVWDAADKTTERGIQEYYQSQMRSGFAPLAEQLVTVSSLEFVKFVAYEIAETL